MTQVLTNLTSVFNAALSDWLAALKPSRIQRAMAYSLKTGGQRLRPQMVYAAGLGFGITLDMLHPFAIAIELIHTYSLIHDDLPAMDNDDLRRGQPSCHRAFDEATAILAGDALQSEAFYLIPSAYENKPHISCSALSQTLGAACRDIVVGQAMDLNLEGHSIDSKNIFTIHEKKTAALFIASLNGAGIISNASPDQINKLQQLGKLVGVAYQIQDDLSDQLSDTCNAVQALGTNQAIDHLITKKAKALKLMDLYFRHHDTLRALIITMLKEPQAH